MISKSNTSTLDDPQTTIRRRKLLEQKIFLNKIYIEFYNRIFSKLSENNKNGYLVELGSGGGFIKKLYSNVITSDIMKLSGVDKRFSALKMPFKKQSINALLMIDVLHHINDLEKFFIEADRCLKKGGQIIMIEPSNTLFGKFIYKNFHHEVYNPQAKWRFESTGPLSGANSALPWIVFIRDRQIFEKKYPEFKIISIEAHTPLKYIISGGFSLTQLLPDPLYPVISFIEFLFSPLNSLIGLFYTINITKIK